MDIVFVVEELDEDTGMWNLVAVRRDGTEAERVLWAVQSSDRRKRCRMAAYKLMPETVREA